MAGNTSHGRGGAGNMRAAPASPGFDPVDLKTPTIKSSTYTTGRGGQGNMQPNVHPDITRQTQDVEAHPRAGREPESHFQYGRGGAGNTVTLNKEEIVKVQERNLSRERAAQTAPATTGESMDEKPKDKGKNPIRGGVGMLQRVMSKGQ